MKKLGIYVFGLATVASGILDLIWGELEPDHQPLQAWGDHIPGVTIFAYIVAVWLVAAGAAILWPRTERLGAGALTILYSIFVLFPLPRFYTAPHYLGHYISVYIGVLDSLCLQIVLVDAAAIVYATLSRPLSPAAALLARWTFGLCSVDFGLAHLTAVQFTAPLVPKWMPWGGDFWTVVSGIAFVLAGLGIVSGILDVLAARLLALMLLIFSAIVLMPMIFASPHQHVMWGGNAYNLTAAGATLIFAEWLATLKQPLEEKQSAKPFPA